MDLPENNATNGQTMRRLLTGLLLASAALMARAGERGDVTLLPMGWQTFGVVAALAWGAVVLAFCTRWIFRAEAKSRREGLCLGEISQAPSAKPIKNPPRLCVSARDKNTLVVLLFFAAIATVEAQKPTNNVPQNLNMPMGGGRVFLTGFTGLTGLEHPAGWQGLGNPVNLVNPVQTIPTQDSFAQRKTANWDVRGAWRDWQGLAAKPNGAPQY